MKTLAIVSSYAESCGNAAFTKILHDTIESAGNLSVEVLELNLKFLQSADRAIRRAANAHIDALCKQLKAFDSVNIQLEPGLYGTIPADIIKRVKKLINANPNTTVTLHSPRLLIEGAVFRSILASLINFHVPLAFRKLSSYLKRMIYIRINRKIIKYATQKGCRLVVHTLRAKEQIGGIYNFKKVDVHPLKLVTDDFMPDPAIIQKLKQPLQVKENDILIGIFGYISPYKGHVDAINAMRYLPDNYKLLIFGRQHPQTISSDGKIDKHLAELITLITKDPVANLQNKVFFLGELSDEEFFHAAACVDLAWLPYYENGQDGSGIASICMDLSPRVLCSTSLAFDELFKLIPYQHYLRFDIGNPLEIASKTKIIMQNGKQNAISNCCSYTIESQVAVYTKDLLVSG